MGERENLHMRAVLKLAALNLALTAMLLRALIPAGWMPAPTVASGSPFVICTVNGPIEPKPAHDADRGHASAPCVFAAAAPLSPPAAIFSAPVSFTFNLIVHEARPEFAPRFSAYRSASPRAPPASA